MAEKLIVSPKSWHYHFAERGGFNCFSPMELCFYTRRVIAGIAKTAIVFSAHGFFASGLINLAMAAWFWQEPSLAGALVGFVAGIGLICLAFVLVIGGLAFLASDESPIQIRALARKASPKAVASTVGLIAATYQGWKDRYCPTIEVKENPHG